jgi:AbrB family looped-hinge helix DNA binding protein
MLDFISRNSYYLSMKSIVSEKGQVTIPKALRDRLGIRTGQVLDFRDERGQLVATKANQEDAVDSVYGILKLRRATNKLMTSLRGSPDTV